MPRYGDLYPGSEYPATQQTTPSSRYHNNPTSAPLPNASFATEEGLPSHMTRNSTAFDQSQDYPGYIPGSEAQFDKEDQGRQDSMAVNALEQTQGQNRANATYQVQQLLLAYELQQAALQQQIEAVQRQHALQLGKYAGYGVTSEAPRSKKRPLADQKEGTRKYPRPERPEMGRNKVSSSFTAFFDYSPQSLYFDKVGMATFTLEDTVQVKQAVLYTLATQNGSIPDTGSQDSENTTEDGHAAKGANEVAVKAEDFKILGLDLPDRTHVDFKYAIAVRQGSQIQYVQAMTGKGILGLPYRLTFSSNWGRFTKKRGAAHHEIGWVVNIAQTRTFGGQIENKGQGKQQVSVEGYSPAEQTNTDVYRGLRHCLDTTTALWEHKTENDCSWRAPANDKPILTEWFHMFYENAYRRQIQRFAQVPAGQDGNPPTDDYTTV